MKEKKNFLMLAIGMGVVGIVIGVFSIWSILKDGLIP